MTQFQTSIWRNIQPFADGEGFTTLGTQLQVLLTAVRQRLFVDITVVNAAFAVELMYVVTQGVVPGETFLTERHGVLQTQELTVTAGDTVAAGRDIAFTVQTGNTVLHGQRLIIAKAQFLTQSHHVVLSVFTQFGTLVTFRHQVKRQTVTQFRRGIRQHIEAVAESAGVAGDVHSLVAADLLHRLRHVGRGLQVQTTEQLVVGVGGIQRASNTADAAVGHHVGVGVFGHGDVHVAVRVFLTLRAPHHAFRGDVFQAFHISPGKDVVEGLSRGSRTCGETGIHADRIQCQGVITRIKRTDRAAGAGTQHITTHTLNRSGGRIAVSWRRPHMRII